MDPTLSGNQALLSYYIRFVKEEKICQELLFDKQLATDTKGELIYLTLEKVFK